MNPLSVRENVPLAPLTTLRVGGPARYFVEVKEPATVAAALELSARLDLPVFLLGGGSNVLIADDGFRGLVIYLDIRGVRIEREGDAAIVRAGAGENWDQLVEQCVSLQLGGIECLSGIPGSVGGTPVQNVGAYGEEVSETITEVEAFDRKRLQVVRLGNSECGFSYRTSIFNSTECDRFIVLSVTYRLAPNGYPTIVYEDLLEAFPPSKGPPSLFEVRNRVIDIRRRKGMVLDPGDVNSRSVGSFFKNPLVKMGQLEELRSRFPEIPAIPMSDGNFKIPGAWLIEQAGFKRGESRGGAGLSSKHSLAIVNRGGATAVEILSFASEIRARVRERFGIELIVEPVLVGFSG